LALVVRARLVECPAYGATFADGTHISHHSAFEGIVRVDRKIGKVSLEGFACLSVEDSDAKGDAADELDIGHERALVTSGFDLPAGVEIGLAGFGRHDQLVLAGPGEVGDRIAACFIGDGVR